MSELGNDTTEEFYRFYCGDPGSSGGGKADSDSSGAQSEHCVYDNFVASNDGYESTSDASGDAATMSGDD